ncbi:MAG: MBOAT family protein, partial [Acidobacteriota bacterium]
NRKGPIRTYVNLAVTMLLGGLWHGAAWTFIAWGAYQGFWLIVERLSGKKSLYGNAPRAVQILITFVIVIFGWVLFRAETLPDALSFSAALLGIGTGVTPLVIEPLHLFAGLAAVIVVWGVPTTQEVLVRAAPTVSIALQLAFLLALGQVHYADHVPFLYFQF